MAWLYIKKAYQNEIMWKNLMQKEYPSKEILLINFLNEMKTTNRKEMTGGRNYIEDNGFQRFQSRKSNQNSRPNQTKQDIG